MEEETQQNQPKKRRFFQQYGIILAILFGAWIIGMSIILAGLLIVRQLNGNKISGTQRLQIDISAGDRVMGRVDAPVTMVEYADFQCPYCKAFQDTIFPQIKQSYIDGGQVKFVFRDFAFLGQESFDAAEAARCAQDQNMFWQYHDLLYKSQGQENSGTFSMDNLKKFAASIGLDAAKFNSCLDDHVHQAEVQASGNEGSQKYQVGSTPTVFVNGVPSEGLMQPVEYQTMITGALQEAKVQKDPLHWLKSLFKTD